LKGFGLNSKRPVAKGSRMTEEFAAFLKEISRF
jgi:hypothetical protein